MSKTLYVARVGLASDLGTIEDLFVTVADVQSQRLELFPELSALPFGVFEMSSTADASACVERFNGFELDGRCLSVANVRPKARGPIATPIKGKTRRAN